MRGQVRLASIAHDSTAELHCLCLHPKPCKHGRRIGRSPFAPFEKARIHCGSSVSLNSFLHDRSLAGIQRINQQYRHTRGPSSWSTRQRRDAKHPIRALDHIISNKMMQYTIDLYRMMCFGTTKVKNPGESPYPCRTGHGCHMGVVLKRPRLRTAMPQLTA